MLSSIHPLGERARHNRWGVTVVAFTLGSVGSAASVGALLGFLGSLAAPPVTFTAMVTAGAALAAGILDVIRMPPPGPARQVNERWIGEYRGWVYGFGFGAQLGAGMATYMVTWGIVATLVAELVSGSPSAGAVVGTAFGAGRALAPLLSGWVDRPGRLTIFHTRMAALGPPVRIAAGVGMVLVGAVGLIA